MSELLSLRNINKFEGSNFQIWKFQVTNVLISLGIKGIVYGTEVRPDEKEAAKAAEWDMKNGKAMAIISDHMSNEQLKTMLTCTTAKEM
ncbi:hypothetical protein TKK_0014600 [Trichogramma kaykai]